MPAGHDLPDPEASLRSLSDNEVRAYWDSCEDWRDRTLAERELARRAWPRWLRRSYWLLVLPLIGFLLYLAIR